MKLTQDQKQILQDKFAKINVNGTCTFCGHNQFTILDKIFEMREFNGGNMIIGGDSEIIPSVLLVCNKCSEIRMFSALALGVLDNSEKKVNQND